MTLYNKYRPQKISELFGNKSLKRELRCFSKGERLWPQSVLFTGPSGCGKTTTAYIMARSMGCAEIDLTVNDAADFRGIDSAREINRKAKLQPLAGPVRFWIIDECHALTNDAQNALLKTVETPPEGSYFIFCTTDPQKMIKTLANRCVRFDFESLDNDDLQGLIASVLEGETEKLEESMIIKISEYAQGSPRQALSILERVLASPEKERKNFVASFAQNEATTIELCRMLLKNGGPRDWKKIAECIKAITDDPETTRRAVLGYMSSVLLNGDNARAASIMSYFIEPFYNTGKPGLTFAAYCAVCGDK